ncbi:MAG: cation transporter [Deltaproteobacteria bacterium]
MTEKTQISLHPFKHRSLPSEHWKDSKEMHRVMHNFSGIFRAVLLELLEHPMSRQEIRDTLNKMRSHRGRRIREAQLRLANSLDKAVQLNVLEQRGGLYHLTPGGREIAEHMEMMIPAFMGWAYSPQTASFFSLWVHVVLSMLKLGIGFLSRSAGLIADGLDNTADTLSSFLVWVGIKYDKEKLASVFILVTMVLSAGGVAVATMGKISHPAPIREGLVAFVVSGLCGLLMLGLSAYQYLVSRKTSSLAIMCQAVDSRNHFYTSVLVCGGILLSFVADTWGAPWLYYGDAVASAVIGLLILRSVVELVQEMFRKRDGEIRVSHFMKRAQERRRSRILLNWLAAQLQRASLTPEELEKNFSADFCEKTPKVFALTGMHYLPMSAEDLKPYLDLFVEQKKLVYDEGKYWFLCR